MCVNWYATLNRQVHKAYESLFSTAACYRWRRWLRVIPDDDHNEPSLSFTRLSQDVVDSDSGLKRQRDIRFGSVPSMSRFNRAWEAAAAKEERGALFLHHGRRRPHHKKGSCKNLIQKLCGLARRLNNMRAERWVQHESEFMICHKECLTGQRTSYSMNLQGKIKSGPSAFYILAVTWNPHPALNFPVKYTTFHVTHTNPAAISLSLNRAESLYWIPLQSTVQL